MSCCNVVLGTHAESYTGPTRHSSICSFWGLLLNVVDEGSVWNNIRRALGFDQRGFWKSVDLGEMVG